MNPLSDIRAVCFDWGGTLMSEEGPPEISMGLWPTVHAISGAAECLSRLASKMPLAIATNASVSRRPMIELALARVDFANYFSEIFCFTDLGHRKSQPEFWHAVTSGLGLQPQQIAMIGDSFEQDALYPRQFGIQGVWFNPAEALTPGFHSEIPQVADLSTFASWVLESV
ncbi:HAD family hydrolase [Variovorax gossypii]